MNNDVKNSTIESIFRWFERYKPEFVSIDDEAIDLETRVLNCVIRLIREYIVCTVKIKNSKTYSYLKNLVIDSSDINSVPLWVGVAKYMNISSVLNVEKDMRVYALQMLLLLRGYDCEMNGEYNDHTYSVVKRAKRDLGVSDYSSSDIHFDFWYKIITGKEIE